MGPWAHGDAVVKQALMRANAKSETQVAGETGTPQVFQIGLDHLL